MEIRSDSFERCGAIPATHASDGGGNASPPIEWIDAPDGATTYALVVDKPDASGRSRVHWVAFNIPERQRRLPEGIPEGRQLANGMVQGVNDFGRHGYVGPRREPGPQVYRFRLFALREPIGLGPDATKSDLLNAMAGKVLAEADVVGVYGGDQGR